MGIRRRGKMTEENKIEYWWKNQCRKCRFRADPKNGTLTDGTCDYIFITGHARLCDMERCKKYEAGPRMRIQKSPFGTKTIKAIKVASDDPERGRTRMDKRVPSRCACAAWLDEKLETYSLKRFAKAAGFGYDRFNKIRKKEGAILPEDLAQKIAKKLNVTVDEIREAERKGNG